MSISEDDIESADDLAALAGVDSATGDKFAVWDASTLSWKSITRAELKIALEQEGVGYSAGNGGTETQATSKSTGVTLNERTGQITMHDAALAADTAVSFALTNSLITATDMVLCQHQSGGTAGAYTVTAQAGSGSATITVRNVTAGSLGEAIVLQFAVFKGATT